MWDKKSNVCEGIADQKDVKQILNRNCSRGRHDLPQEIKD